jgi:hypothetical protein
MSQVTDWSTDNLLGGPFRAQLNGILAAIQSSSEGAGEPTPTVPGMLWYDTSTTPGILKVRNVGNTAWEVATDPVIASGVISAGAVSEIAVLIPPEYKSVQVRLRGFAPVTNGASLQFQVGTGTLGSPVWQTSYAQPHLYSVGSTVGASTATPSSLALCGFSSSSAPYAQKTIADLSGFNEAGKFDYLAHGYSTDLTPDNVLNVLGGSEESISTRTLLRLFASTGNIKNLTYTIIGSAY